MNKINIETSQLQRFANQLTGFYIIKVFPETYFRTDYNHIFLLNVGFKSGRLTILKEYTLSSNNQWSNLPRKKPRWL